MASGRTALSNAKSGRNVGPDSRLAFGLQVRQTHRTHRTQGIIFADAEHVPKVNRVYREMPIQVWELSDTEMS